MKPNLKEHLKSVLLSNCSSITQTQPNEPYYFCVQFTTILLTHDLTLQESVIHLRHSCIFEYQPLLGRPLTRTCVQRPIRANNVTLYQWVFFSLKKIFLKKPLSHMLFLEYLFKKKSLVFQIILTLFLINLSQ